MTRPERMLIIFLSFAMGFAGFLGRDNVTRILLRDPSPIVISQVVEETHIPQTKVRNTEGCRALTEANNGEPNPLCLYTE